MPTVVVAKPQALQQTTRASLRSRLGSLARIDVLFPAIVVLGVLVLGSLGLSGSSVAGLSTSGRIPKSDVIVGDPQIIRTDEYRASTPVRVGRVEAGFPERATFGLGSEKIGNSWRPWIPSRSPGAVLYAPWNLPLVTLPLEQGFAFTWWLPIAGCLLGVYAWLRAMRVSAGFALGTAILAGSAPAAVWWSNYVVQPIAATTIPAALLIAAARTRSRMPRVALGIAVAAGLSAASVPWFYQPWEIVVSLFVFGVTFLWGISDPETRRSFVITAAVAGAVFIVEEAVYLLHERSYYEALADTVYPGNRRNLAGGVPIGRLFSSVVPFSVLGHSGTLIINDNLSELSMGWTIALPIVLTAAILGWRTLRHDREQVLVFGALLLSLGLTSWCLVRWPDLVGTVSFLRFVPPNRLAPYVGFFGVVSLALLFGVPDRRARLTRELGTIGIVIVVLVTGFVAAWGATEFKFYALPSLSSLHMWVAVTVLMAAVLALCTRLWPVGLGVVCVLALVSGAAVNPLMHGLGDLTNSSAAATVRHVDKSIVARDGQNWASDSGDVNALLNAQGVNNLSSYNDPVHKSAWRVLDPRGQYEEQWNRFGYIVFQWEAGRPSLKVENPAEDIVLVTIDPCDQHFARLRLRVVVSSEPLPDATCLTQVTQMRWMGKPAIVYERTATPGS